MVSSTGALSLQKVPEKMIVIGAGVIGVELVCKKNLLSGLKSIYRVPSRIYSNWLLEVKKILAEFSETN